MNKSLVGVDIGGSHVTASYVDPVSFNIHPDSVVRQQVDSLASKDDILSAWVSILSRLAIPANAQVGIAMPAPFDYAQGVAKLREQGKFRSIYGVNLRDYLAAKLRLPHKALFFYNDAASFLQGEALFQQVPDTRRVLGITLGTGLGSAYRFGLRAEDAALWSSEFKGRQAEYFLGTGWFVRWAREEHNIEISGLKELMENPNWIGLAKEALDLFGANLGEFLAVHCRYQQIDQIVIGGNLSKASMHFAPIMQRELTTRFRDVPVVFSQLGEHAALVGAASSCLF